MSRAWLIWYGEYEEREVVAIRTIESEADAIIAMYPEDLYRDPNPLWLDAPLPTSVVASLGRLALDREGRQAKRADVKLRDGSTVRNVRYFNPLGYEIVEPEGQI